MSSDKKNKLIKRAEREGASDPAEIVTICRFLHFRGRVPRLNLSPSDENRELIAAAMKTAMLTDEKLDTPELLARSGEFCNGSPCIACISNIGNKLNQCLDCVEILPVATWALVAAARREWLLNSEIGRKYAKSINETLAKCRSMQIDSETEAKEPEAKEPEAPLQKNDVRVPENAHVGSATAAFAFEPTTTKEDYNFFFRILGL